MSIIDPSVQIAIITTIAGALGAFLAGAFAFATSWINKRSEERKHMREQVIRAAIEYWQKHHELVQSANNGKLTQVVPLDSYLVHIAAIMSSVMSQKLSHENVVALLQEAHKISEAADNEIRRISKP
jgi:uncharacterized membrane protein